jgi:predicted deacylase
LIQFAEKMDDFIISTELGGAGMVTRHSAKLTVDGLVRMVAALGHLLVKEASPSSRFVNLAAFKNFLTCNDNMILYRPFI